MQYTFILTAALLTFTTSTFSAPAPAPAPPERDLFQEPTPYATRSISPAFDSISPADSDLQKRNDGGVRLSDGPDFTGRVWYGILPLAECIALNFYAGNLGSFRPDQGTECLLYQGDCDDEADFADLHHDSPQVGSLAKTYPWIGKVESFMCFTEL